MRKIKSSLIKPQIIDAHNSKLKTKISIKSDHTFENFEYSRALKIGLSESIKRINDIGILKIEKDIKLKSNYFRDKLKKKNDFLFPRK